MSLAGGAHPGPCLRAVTGGKGERVWREGLGRVEKEKVKWENGEDEIGEKERERI